MFCLSQSVGYAIRALTCMERGCSGPRSVKDIAACSGVPSPYLAKLVKRLVDARILASKRGIGGGVWLDLPAQAISMLEVSEAIDGPRMLNQCLLGMAHCSDERSCPTHEFWKVERETIRQKLATTTLSDVIAFEDERQAAASKQTQRSCTPKPQARA